MKKKLFTPIYDENKVRFNLSIDPRLKQKLEELKAKNDISISERVEALYRQHQKIIEGIEVPQSLFPRGKGQRGVGMYSENQQVRVTCGIHITPSAKKFLELSAKQKGTDCSKLIELALKQIYD